MKPYAILRGHVLDCLNELGDETIQCCVTSPPYYGLRDYKLPPSPWPAVTFSPLAGLPPMTIPAGEECLGLESDPWAFVGHIVEVFRGVRRVLRDDGVLWVNFGDSYNAAGRVGHGTCVGYKQQTLRASANGVDSCRPTDSVLKLKDLLGMPWRIAFALQADGWFLRSDVIWAKPNPMPASVKDRPTTAHEYIFLLCKSARYAYDAEAIKTDAKAFRKGGRNNVLDHPKTPDSNKKQDATGNPTYTGFNDRYNGAPVGKANRRSVWTITPASRKEAHFATFPDEIPRLCIAAGAPEGGACPECGKPLAREIVVGEPLREWQQACGADSDGVYTGQSQKGHEAAGVQDASAVKARILKGMVEKTTVGWKPACSCPVAPPRPCAVLDPFAGRGTTIEQAVLMGRWGVGIELNPEYADMAERNCELATHPPVVG